MQSNIKGLNELVSSIDNKINHVNKLHAELDITGGDGILVSKYGNRYVINSIDKSTSLENTKPWDIRLQRVEDSSSEEYDVSTYGGCINGFLPDNWDDFGTIDEDSPLQYVILSLECTPDGVSFAQLELTETLSTELNRQFSKNEIPTSFDILIAITYSNRILTQQVRGHLQVIPKLAYQFENLDRITDLDNFYTWSVYEEG